MTDTPETTAPAPASTVHPDIADPRTPGTRKVLGILAFLGALAMALSIFLWWQLVVSRQGGTPLCGVGEDGACGALWDSAFASSIQRGTSVPVAGWGWIWGLAALVLPLGALWRKNVEAVAAWITGVRWVAVAGVVSTVVLAAVAVGEGVFCAGCFATYALVAAYAGLALWGLREHGFVDGFQAVWIALGAVSAGYLLALWPGLQTPSNAQQLAQEAIAGLEAPAPGTPGPGTSAPGQAAQPPAPGTAADALGQFLERLDPSTAQTLADTLYVYGQEEPVTGPEPRALVGPENAAVVVTDFTDPLCPACAQFHSNLAAFFRLLPERVMAVDSRHFPLDGACNPYVNADRGGLRCLAAKAQICMEGHPQAFEMSSRIFEAQQNLTEAQVRQIAGGYLGSIALDACLGSEATEAKLQEDVEFAQGLGLSGTPLILVNGREAQNFGPLLYVLALTGGDPKHPALAGLPQPSKEAKAGDLHAGHGH